MRTTIAWGDGSGDNIYLDYTAASGSQTVTVSSDANGTWEERRKTITFATTGANPVTATLTVIQASNGDLLVVTRDDVCVTYNDVAAGWPFNGIYRKLTGIIFDGNMYYDTGVKLAGGDTVRLSYKVSKACNVFGCYTTTTATNNYSLYLSLTSGAKYMRYGNGTYDSYMVTNKRYDVVITPTGSSGLENDSTWTAKTFNCTTNCLIGTTSVEATSAKLTGTVYGDFIIEGKCQYAPVERISDGAIGYVDLLTGHFSENLGTGTPQALGYA